MIFDKLNASDEVYGLWQQPCFNETLDCTGLHFLCSSLLGYIRSQGLVFKHPGIGKVAVRAGNAAASKI